MAEGSKLHLTQAGILLVTLSAILWGTVGVATQAIFIQSDLTPFSVAFYRMAFAFPIVAFYCGKVVGKKVLRVEVSVYFKMSMIGILMALYQVFFFAAIEQVGVSVATLIAPCTAPVIVALASSVFLKERFTIYTCIALLAALSGTVLLVGVPESFNAQGSIVLGVGLSLCSATGYAIMVMLGRTIAHKCHPLHSTAVSFAVGSVVLLPLAAGNICSTPHAIEVWGLILYVGFVPTAVAYALFFLGMRNVKASTAAILTLFEPLTATILAYFLFAERLAVPGMLGAILLFAAMAVLIKGEKVTK